nr:hypothetical protein [Nitrosomonas nitrosa]
MSNAGIKKERVYNSLPGKSEQSLAGKSSLGIEKYRAMLDGEIPDEQAEALLTALLDIMRHCVDLGWGVTSVHYLLPDLFGKASELESDAVKSENRNKDKLEDALMDGAEVE